MFVRAIQGLVALRGRIPAHTDRQHVRIDGAFQRREIKLQALFTVLLVLQPPAGHRHQRSEEHTSELQSRLHLVCRLLLEKKKKKKIKNCNIKQKTTNNTEV